jgi:transposase-like protein
MPRKGHSPEQVLAKLRQVEVAVAKGKSVGQAVREIGVTDHTYYRWRRDLPDPSAPMTPLGKSSENRAKTLDRLSQVFL